MTDGDQSRKDVSTPTADLLTPKAWIKVGCWNVRTLYQTGKLAQAVNELNRYNLTLMGVTEARWTGTGKQKLNTGEVIIWSGRSDNDHREGVAIIISKSKANTVLQWKPVNERLLYVRMNSKYAKLSVVVGYAPIDDAEEEEKDTFYDALQAVLEDVPRHDVMMLIGDFNAKVGCANVDRERTMGRHGVGVMTDNGERLVNLCEENDLVIGGTLFAHKDIHKLTWTSPDGKTQNQIDHIIINGRWRHSLQDVRVMRNADIGSDHNLLVAKVTLKLRKARIGDNRNQRYDVAKLKDPKVKEEFRLALRNRFSVLDDETALTINNFNSVMREVGDKVLGYRKNKKSEWISEDTLSRIEERREIKKRLLDTKSPRLKERITKEYSEKNKEVKTSARKDKRDYIERLAEEAEAAAEQGDMKTVYQNTKKLKGDYGQYHDLPVKAEDGTHVTIEEEKLKRWKQHFESILNRPDPPVLADIPEAEEDLDINLGDITVDEVKQAIHKLKNGKAPGEDGVCPEMLKVEDTVTPQLLCQIFQKIWDSEEAPSDWKTGTIIKLPKKGDLGNCNNWRGITLLSLTSKIFSRILLQRITSAVDGILRQEQAGFRKGKSCIDHIFVLRQILEQTHEWNGSLYVVFVDFEKAFDSLHRDSLWKILRHYGIPQKLVNVIKSIYENFQCRVIHNNMLTEPFEVKTGVKQGCILSPILFSLAIDWIMCRTTVGRRQGIQWTLTSMLDDLDYADDIGLLSSRNQDTQQKTQQLAESASAIGLKVNIGKTQVMRKNTRGGDPIIINDQPLEEVEEFSYLGSKVTTDGDCAREISTRISKANQAFAMLKPIWRTTSLSVHTKIRIFNSNVLSVLLYGSECWKTTATIERKLEVFQTKCLRRIMKIFWPNMISNEELWHRAGASSIAETIATRRWRWLGHVCRMPPDSLPRVALRWTPQGKRNRGRPKETWRRTVERELKSRGLTLQTAPTIAADRQKWRSLAVAPSTSRRRRD
jgi:endonuclease/exonuclease/phosphatase family metal-dependent hydrolase